VPSAPAAPPTEAKTAETKTAETKTAETKAPGTRPAAPTKHHKTASAPHPAEAAKEAAASPAPAAGSTVYTLQLDSFLVPENAAGLIERMTKRGDKAYDKVEPEDGKAWHKVRSGAYATLAEAEAAAKDLKQSEGIDALVVETTADDVK
jgi:cell division septation protein DedD